MTASVPHKRIRTDTPGVYRYHRMFVVGWTENGRKQWRSFPTYEQACEFRRDFVVPFRERRGLPPTIAAPRELRGRGFVYFAQSKGPGAHVKIGYSKNVAQRLARLETAHPHGLDLVALLPGDERLEAHLHRVFAPYRLSREWFTRDVVTRLSALVMTADPGSLVHVGTPSTVIELKEVA